MLDAALLPAMRIVLLGYGAVAQTYYAPALRQLEREGLVRLVGVYDAVAERALAAHKRFPDALVLERLDDCSKHAAELAIVASPNRYHAEQAIHLLASGLSVLCEKPMATSVEEADRMVAAAASAERVLCVGNFRRFFPAMQAVSTLLANQTLGLPLEFDFSEGGRFAWGATSPALFHRAEAGGGVLIDMGVHHVDLLVWWFGEPIDVDFEDDAMGGVEANCTLRLRFDGGMTGRVRLSRDHRLPNRCRIRCERGSIAWDVWDKTRAEALDLEIPGVEAPVSGVLRGARTVEQSFIAQLRNVVRAVRGVEPAAVSGEIAVATLRVIERAYREARPMSMPWLSDDEQRGLDRIRGVCREGAAWPA